MEPQVTQFFEPDGTLKSIPVKNSKRIEVLKIISANFTPSVRYSEKEVNEVISRFHSDTAALRRYMIEFGILKRDSSSTYWVPDNS